MTLITDVVMIAGLIVALFGCAVGATWCIARPFLAWQERRTVDERRHPPP